MTLSPKAPPKPRTDDATTANNRHLPALDGLRGIAVFLVVLFHFWQTSWLDYTALLHSPWELTFIPAMGFFGVDLFFFLSAFCLTLPYARHWNGAGPAPTLPHFLSRRAAKILPSYGLAVALRLTVLPDPAIPKDRLWFHLGTHLLFVHNLFLETLYSLTGVFWSLAVEVQFYALFPLLMLGCRRRPLLTVVALAGAAALWRAWCLHAFAANGDSMLLTWRDSQLPAYLDVFAAGIAAALVWAKAQSDAGLARWRPLCIVTVVLSFAAFVAQMHHCYSATVSDMPITVWQMRHRTLGAATLLLLGGSACLAPRPFQRLLGNPALVFLSTISYNLYLWHTVVAGWLRDHHLPPWTGADPHNDRHWMPVFNLAAWAASVALASAVTFLWERPFLRGGWRKPRATDRPSAPAA